MHSGYYSLKSKKEVCMENKKCEFSSKPAEVSNKASTCRGSDLPWMQEPVGNYRFEQ